MPAKKTVGTKAVPRKASVKKIAGTKAAPRKASVKKTAARAATPVRRTSTGAIRARRGDLIVIDSPQVGSPPREGEVLRVIHGEVSVSYRVKWADGHETLISPAAGTVTIVRA